jgi:hypothetical protein
MRSVPLIRELAQRRRTAFAALDRRTPEERRFDNEYLVECLEGRLPPELHQRLVELVIGRDIDWSTDVMRALGRETYLDVCEAIVTMDREG